jgi:thioredoxin reductase (NADPH)
VLRGGFSCTIIENGAGALEKAALIENYYGFAEPITGAKLAHHGKAQAARLGAQFVRGEVVSLLPDEAGGFALGLADGAVLTARTLVLAAGSPRKSPKIPGLAELEGHGVSYCAVCDAFFYRKKAVAVLGFGAYAKEEAAHLLPMAASVTLLTNGEGAGADFPENVQIRTQTVEAVLGDGHVTGVQLAGGVTVPVDGVFVAYGSAGSADLARKIGAVVEGNTIVTDALGATNIPGLYAAGDCVGGTLQVAKAVCDGMTVGLSLGRFLRKEA